MATNSSDQLRDGIRKLAELSSKPLNLDDLIAQGLLTKAGAYYRVRNMQELPEHVASRIVEIVRDTKGNKVKFGKVSKRDAQRLSRLKQL